MPNLKFLDLKIEVARERLEDLAAKHGRTHSTVINYSQRLDKLIVLRQRLVMVA